MRTPHRLAATALAVLVLAAAGCSSSPPKPPVDWTAVSGAPPAGPTASLIAAAEKEGTLNVIGLPAGQADWAAIINDFARTYGIKVRQEYPGATSQQDISQAKLENGTARAPDVFSLDMNVALANANLFAPYKVSTWNAIPTALKDPAGLWAAAYGGYMSVGYAPRFGTITSLNQLLAPQFRHAVALTASPASAPGPGLNGVMLADPALNAVMMAGLAEGGHSGGIAAGIAWFRELGTAGNLATVTATPATIKAGITPVVFNWDYLNQPAVTGVPGWKTFIPPGAVLGGYYTQAINKDAPHPAAARLWEEFLYSQAANGGQNLFLQAGARPAELAAMTADGTVDTAAAARLPKAVGPPLFLTPALATTAAPHRQLGERSTCTKLTGRRRSGGSRLGLGSRTRLCALALFVHLLRGDEQDVLARGLPDVVREARGAVSRKSRVPGIEAPDRQEVAGAGQPAEVPRAQHRAPFGFAERQYPPGLARLGRGEHDDVHFDLVTVSRIVDDARAHLGGQFAEDVRADGELAAQCLEVRAYHPGKEGRAGGLPGGFGPAEFEFRPARPHDRLVEADQRLGDPVAGPAAADQVGFAHDQPGILEHVQRVAELVGSPAGVAGDAAVGPVAAGDGGQHGMVDRRAADIGLLGEQVARLAEQRHLRVQHGARHPRVEVTGPRGYVAADEFPPVGGGTADNGMNEDRQ